MSVFYGEKGSRSSGAGEREPQADGKGTYDRILSADEYDKYRLTQIKRFPHKCRQNRDSVRENS